MKIRKDTLKKIIAEATTGYDMSNVEISGAGSGRFSLMDAGGELDLTGYLLNPSDLRVLAAALERLYDGRAVPAGRVALELD